MQCIRYVPSLDCYISCSQKGTIALWTSKVNFFLVTKCFGGWGGSCVGWRAGDLDGDRSLCDLVSYPFSSSFQPLSL